MAEHSNLRLSGQCMHRDVVLAKRFRRQRGSLALLLLAWVGVLLIGSSVVCAQESSQVRAGTSEHPASTLLYVSDYFSFIGKDETGRVAFALDINRGRDGDTYQAEHFVVLHDEREGWIDVQGNGAYDNVTEELDTIPESAFFHVSGSRNAGIVIASVANDLTLSIEKMPVQLSRIHKGGNFSMGSASAVLEWAGRTLEGRVIYEYLLVPEFNRLTRTYWRMWNEFQGLYVSLDGRGDVYLHSQGSELLTPLIGELDGFLAVEGEAERFQVLQFTPLRMSQGLGFYRWPEEWAVRWLTSSGGGTMHLTLSEFNQIGNWVIGGFAMGIVQGQLEYQGQSYHVYGLAELIM